MDGWLVGIILYLATLSVTSLPIWKAWLRKIELFPEGASPDESVLLSEEGKRRLAQSHSRMMGTLKFWKKQAEIYKRLHYYALGWVVPSSVLVPFFSQAVTQDPYSKWFLSLVSASSAILLTFHQWLKVEQNYKAFRLGESNYYDLRRRLLDRPRTFGVSESEQLDLYLQEVEKIRKVTRDAEINNFPGAELSKPSFPKGDGPLRGPEQS